MSKRSKSWLKKKDELDLKEEALKGELDEVSDDIEKQVKSIVKISLITGGVFLATYGLYKMFSSSKPETIEIPVKREKPIEQEKKAKVKTSPIGFSMKNLIIERLTVMGIKFIGEQLSLILNRKLGAEEESETDN